MKKFSPVIFAILLALTFRIYLVAMFKVPGQSMAPTILAGDYVMGTQLYSQPKTGELVVYIGHTRTYVKRVIAAGGDEVEYKDGQFVINAKTCEYRQQDGLFDAAYVLFEENCGGQVRKVLKPGNSSANPFTLAAVKLAEGEFLVASDNRSPDPNLILAEIVRSDQIVGKPVVVWMSYSSTQDFISKSLGVRWNRILTILR